MVSIISQHVLIITKVTREYSFSDYAVTWFSETRVVMGVV